MQYQLVHLSLYMPSGNNSRQPPNPLFTTNFQIDNPALKWSELNGPGLLSQIYFYIHHNSIILVTSSVGTMAVAFRICAIRCFLKYLAFFAFIVLLKACKTFINSSKQHSQQRGWHLDVCSQCTSKKVFTTPFYF